MFSSELSSDNSESKLQSGFGSTPISLTLCGQRIFNLKAPLKQQQDQSQKLVAESMNLIEIKLKELVKIFSI